MKETENKPAIARFFSRLLQFTLQSFRQIRQKHLAFLFFVALAAVMWLLRALSDEYIAEIDYPVKYINLPPNRILSQPPLEKLSLQVQSDGYTILKSRFMPKRPLPYNVNTFALYSLTEDSTSVYTLTRYQRDRLSTELNRINKNIRILDIDPDTLIFNFSRVRRRRVPVVPRLEKTPDLFARQHMLNGKPYTIPDSIEVTGPSYIVDTLQAIYTEPLKLRNLSDTVERKVLLKKVNRTTFPIKKIHTVIPVDEFTESEYSIPIITENVPDSLTLKTFPRTVHVRFLVTLYNYQHVNEQMFHARVNYNSIDSLLTPRLRVELDSLPDFIQNVSINPRNVEFLIEK